MEKLKWKYIRGKWSNVQMIESWLSDMAKKGFALKEINETKATFEEAQSEDIIYRIKYMPEEKDNKDESISKDDLYAQICSKGWEYICAYGYYLVFKATDNINYKDLPVYDFEFKQYLKENRKEILMYSVTVIIVMFTLFINLFGFDFPLHIRTYLFVEKGGFALLCFWFLSFLVVAATYILLFSERKKIKLGSRPKVNRRKRWLVSLVYVCLVVVIMAYSFYGLFGPKQEFSLDEAPEKVIKLSDIEDIREGLTLRKYSSHEVSSSFLAPYQYHLDESYYDYDPNIEVYYYELRFKFLANSLKRDLEKYWFDGAYEIESEYFDFVESETGEGNKNFFVIYGNIVFSIDYSGEKTKEEVLEILKEKFKQLDL